MKYLMFFCEGLAGEPVEDLGGKTPLEVAKTPFLNSLAKNAETGTVSFVPHSLTASSDVATLSALGCDPLQFYTGLAPLEAAAAGISQASEDVAFRCDLVTVLDDVMVDPRAGFISDRESRLLITELASKLGIVKARFVPGGGYKNILMVGGAEADVLDDLETVPPAAFVGEKLSKYLPKGKGARVLVEWMEKAGAILENHEINRVRIDLKENPANRIWLWGQGKKPGLPVFAKQYGVDGAVVSDAASAKGVAMLMGMKASEDAVEALAKADFVFVYHSETPSETQSLKSKIKRIEDFDSKVLGPAVRAAEKSGSFRVCVTTGFVESLPKKSALHGSVPFLIAGSDIAGGASAETFSEKTASQGKSYFQEGKQLIEFFLKLKK